MDKAEHWKLNILFPEYKVTYYLLFHSPPSICRTFHFLQDIHCTPSFPCFCWAREHRFVWFSKEWFKTVMMKRVQHFLFSKSFIVTLVHSSFSVSFLIVVTVILSKHYIFNFLFIFEDLISIYNKANRSC